MPALIFSLVVLVATAWAVRFLYRCGQEQDRDIDELLYASRYGMREDSYDQLAHGR